MSQSHLPLFAFPHAQEGITQRGKQLPAPVTLRAGSPSLRSVSSQPRRRLGANPASQRELPRLFRCHSGTANTHTHAHVRPNPPQGPGLCVGLLRALPKHQETHQIDPNLRVGNKKRGKRVNSTAAGSILGKPHNLGVTVSLLSEKSNKFK